MQSINPKVHGILLIVSICGMVIAFLAVMLVLVHNAWVHDGTDNQTLVWFGIGTGVVLAVVLLGVPVVVALLKGMGLPVPDINLPTITSGSPPSTPPTNTPA